MNGDVTGVRSCAALYEAAKQLKKKIVILDFGSATWLDSIPVAFLGSLRILLEQQQCQVLPDFSNCNVRVRDHLMRCGFMQSWYLSLLERGLDLPAGHLTRDNIKKIESIEGLEEIKKMLDGVSVKGTSIGLRHFPTFVPTRITSFLRDEWLHRGGFDVTPEQQEYVLSSIGELFVNGFTHADSPVGVISFGQYFPRPGRLKLVVMDLGVGIPETIRRRLERQHQIGWLNDGPALEWAFEKGHSSTRTARGLGLAIMREFIVNNSGTLSVYSLNGYGSISNRSYFVTHSVPFPGTVVEIALKSLRYVPPLAEIAF